MGSERISANSACPLSLRNWSKTRNDWEFGGRVPGAEANQSKPGASHAWSVRGVPLCVGAEAPDDPLESQAQCPDGDEHCHVQQQLKY